MEMDERIMITADTLRLAAFLVASLTGGVLLGLVYFAAVRRTADLIVAGRQTLLALGLVLGRMALLGAVFFWALHFGALALIAVAAGVLVGRAVVLRRSKGEVP
ncbi:N-ATPase subunit AtpR [Pseudogemmobacter sp. W21_MBD1_M6]|uniref:N-ATPase subunit AtpR n=1 Tax=Pseudogemmobacter sp. W21_MBD1_M6 TaxID=3240271 RepID=UPI003F94943B